MAGNQVCLSKLDRKFLFTHQVASYSDDGKEDLEEQKMVSERVNRLSLVDEAD